MGHDSSDFLKCEMCNIYEIDQRAYNYGIEAGMFQCDEGHTFCEDCVKNKESLTKITKIYEEQEEQVDDTYDISIPVELCPICSKIEADKKDPNALIRMEGLFELDKRRGVFYFHSKNGTALRICGLKVPVDFGAPTDNIDITIKNDTCYIVYNKS